MIALFFLIRIVISLTNAAIFIAILNRPINTVLTIVAPNELGRQYKKLLSFALYIYSLAGGVQAYRFFYMTDNDLTSNRWVLEIINSMISSMRNLFENLLATLGFILIAVAVVSRLQKEWQTE